MGKIVSIEKVRVSEYEKLFENESTHFYYVALHNLVISVVKSLIPSHLPAGRQGTTPVTILDAGCGTGLLSKKLKQYGRVTSVDISSEAIKFCQQRGINAIKASINKLPFKASSFNIVTSIDVLYHKGVNDKLAIKEFYRVIQPKGFLILRVAANNWLSSEHDQKVHTRHRYSKIEIGEKLEGAGFRVAKLSFMNFSLLPAAILFKNLSLNKVNPFINFIFKYILAVENKVLRHINFPQGVGLLAVAQKYDSHPQKNPPCGEFFWLRRIVSQVLFMAIINLCPQASGLGKATFYLRRQANAPFGGCSGEVFLFSPSFLDRLGPR